MSSSNSKIKSLYLICPKRGGRKKYCIIPFMVLSCGRQLQTYHSYLELFEEAVCYAAHRSGKNSHREL